MTEEKFKFTKLIPSICFLIVGIALVINQNFLNEVCKLAGYFFIFAAVVCLILYFAKKSVDGQRQGKFAVFTVLLLIGGVFLEILPVFLEFLIPIFIGLTLLADGFYGMSNSFAARAFGNKWIAGFILLCNNCCFRCADNCQIQILYGITSMVYRCIIHCSICF